MVKDLCFEVIEACPNECRFCSSNSCLNKKQIIQFDDFKRVIDYFVTEGGIEELSLSGGEPFLHFDIFKMVQYSKSKGIRTVIFTSGIKKSLPLSNREIEFYKTEMNNKLAEIEKFEPWNDRIKNNIKKYYERFINPSMFSAISKEELRQLKHIGLDKIVFDYQAYSHEVDEYLMGRNREKHCCLLDSMLNAVSVGIETEVHFIPMKPNYREISDILEMVEIAGIRSVSILNFVPQGRGLKNINELMLTNVELNEFMDLLHSSKNKYNGKIRIGIPLMEENAHKCNAGLEKLDIKYDGTVLPCPAFKDLDLETMKKYGLKYYNIYENLEKVKTPGGKRVQPLCRKIYKKYES